ncbi:MAG: NAD(P)/FAD-dependent oxidoreductase [Ardenticatenaceae bacterium]|nr:NAD(P)/FAD-dependent oxidoreductase [Anaerolineales bacterium]MCB8941906.1 NAD(P)/FAD-dependent oxidoreductase [Ardenticatenaceae bacterium]MCB8973020.1 NAD(P)/FAD-dependent oxidoreductase [Ardenticatenaceae bacterium]
MTQTDFDIVIIGSGMSGSALGAILARHGQRVVIFEAKTHPRFAIGESLILETSEMMRALAHFYDVPELAYFSTENFMAFAGTTHGIKRHFGFLHHEKGQPHNPAHTLQAIIPKEPHGHELHLYRQDTDYFMMSTAVSYGAQVRQNTAVQDVQLHDDHVTIFPAKGEPVTAKYVVDAGGYRSILAQQYGQRDFNLQTHSRGMFTHMINVPGHARANGSQEKYELPFPMAEGTLHHIFEGGWLWVIPFDNHAESTNPLCSVGLLLDPRIHPPRPDLSPEEEFFSFIEQFPNIAKQFAGATAVRDWTRADRLQYNTKQVVGDRWALLGHAAGFIDPFYSKGLYSTLTAVFIVAHNLLKAEKTGDYSAEAFADVQTVTHNFVCSADRLIANSYRSFGNYKLWQVYSVMWLLGAYTELVKLNMMRAQTLQAGQDRQGYYDQLVTLRLCGGGYAEFVEVANKVDTLIEKVDPHDETAVTATVAEINQIFRNLSWIADPFVALLDGKTYLPKNKLRLSLLKPGEGFMRSGAYKAHFFGNLTMWDLLLYGAKEKLLYARPFLNRQHRQKFQKQQ